MQALKAIDLMPCGGALFRTLDIKEIHRLQPLHAELLSKSHLGFLKQSIYLCKLPFPRLFVFASPTDLMCTLIHSNALLHFRCDEAVGEAKQLSTN